MLEDATRQLAELHGDVLLSDMLAYHGLGGDLVLARS